MIVTVRLFAKLREQLGSDQLSVEIQCAQASVDSVVDSLAQSRGDDWHRELCAPNVLCAVNRKVVERDTLIGEGDEVAFFPPVTGG